MIRNGTEWRWGGGEGGGGNYFLSWCFTSTETVWRIRDEGEWDKECEPRPTSLFTQLLNSEGETENTVHHIFKLQRVAKRTEVHFEIQ